MAGEILNRDGGTLHPHTTSDRSTTGKQEQRDLLELLEHSLDHAVGMMGELRSDDIDFRFWNGHYQGEIHAFKISIERVEHHYGFK